MKQVFLKILSNERLTDSVYKMRLGGDVSAITAPGQFINIRLEGLFLRRPISVFDVDAESVTIIYKVVGEGTARMSRMTADSPALDVLTGLGNGYDLRRAGDKPLLIGGGVGVPPLYLLAKRLRAEGKDVTVVLGFNTAAEMFCEADFRALGCRVLTATADGSYGVKGFVTDAVREDGGEYSYFYTCGPEPMLKAIYKSLPIAGEFSFEERMGCGFGACMGCSCKTVTGNKRICLEGPVMRREDIIW